MKTLALRLAHALTVREKSPADLARAIKKSESAVSQWLSGDVLSMRSDSLMAVSSFLSCSPQWLAAGKGKSGLDANLQLEEIPFNDNPDFPAVRRVSVKASAGVSGFGVEYSPESDGDPIVFRKSWFKMKGYHPPDLIAVRVAGESMIPNLYDGDIIVVNTAQTEQKDGLAFLVNYEGEIVVKRLVRDDGVWWLASDNPDQRRYSRKVCNEQTQIIGEVVYRQTERV